MVTKTRFLMALSVLGCALSLCSAIFPFVVTEPYPGHFPPFSSNVYYWSFKSSTQHMVFNEPSGPAVESWFCDFWVKTTPYGTGFLPLFASMSAAQILALITGVAHLFIKKKYLVLVPAALCALIAASMTYVIASLSKANVWWDFQHGYGLTILSLCVFLSVPILSRAWRKRYDETNVTGTGSAALAEATKNQSE